MFSSENKHPALIVCLHVYLEEFRYIMYMGGKTFEVIFNDVMTIQT